MDAKTIFFGVILIGLAPLVGCSQATPPPAITAQAAAAPSAENPATANDSDDDDASSTRINCAKIFSPTDAAGMLKGKVTISAETFRDNACLFEAEDHSNIELLYSGEDIGTQVVWRHASSDSRDYKPLAAVGDQAFYSDGSTGGPPQILGKKGGHYCSAAAGGNGFTLQGEALAVQLGALCNKLFAAH